MKNNVKNRSESDSYSASKGATLLGISIPTVKRMFAEGRLKGFRTPGGHVRITAESIEAVREPRSLHDVSPVLQNRREQIEELTLEAQATRAKRDLAKLKREEQDEIDRSEAEAEARKQEAAQRQAELKLERERLTLEKRQQTAREKVREAEESRRREAERALIAFRCRWQQKANEALSGYQYRWLSHGQRKEILDGLEDEIQTRQPSEEPSMPVIIARTLTALLEPLEAERDAQEKRQQVTAQTLRSLPSGATEGEQVRARDAIRQALGHSDSLADLGAMRVAAMEAARPICQAVKRRTVEESVIFLALWGLPVGHTEQDKAQLRRKCSAILAELPLDISEAEAKEALAATIAETQAEIGRRQAETSRQARKAAFVQHGLSHVTTYMFDLSSQEEIDRDQLFDSELRRQIECAVRESLQSGLSGDETTQEVQEKVRAIVDDEITRQTRPTAKGQRRQRRRDQWE